MLVQPCTQRLVQFLLVLAFAFTLLGPLTPTAAAGDHEGGSSCVAWNSKHRPRPSCEP
jgi:hypothetical protein